MSAPRIKRICQIIKLKPGSEKEYIDIHANVWPSVLSALEQHHIVDYSIHYHKPLCLLIATMKYTGNDYDKDMADMAADPETQKWWKLTDSMQESLVDGATGSGKEIPWWLDLDEVFRFEGKS